MEGPSDTGDLSFPLAMFNCYIRIPCNYKYITLYLFYYVSKTAVNVPLYSNGMLNTGLSTTSLLYSNMLVLHCKNLLR